ncbi:unnamed protein product, partial [marine sediment metagenome]
FTAPTDDKVLKTGPEIDDCAEKSKTETITGIWTFEARISANGGMLLPNAEELTANNFAGDPSVSILRVTAGDQCQLSNDIFATVIRGTSIDLQADTTVTGSANVTGNVIAQGLVSGGFVESTSTMSAFGNFVHTGTNIGLYGVPTVPQATTGIASASHAALGGFNVDENDTFGGYTIGQIVTALQDIGILA